MRNEKGVIIWAVVMSLLMVMGAVVVFSLVSGRFGITTHYVKRIQAIRDAEAASYVCYQLRSEGAGDWNTNGPHTVTLVKPDGNFGVTVNVNNQTVTARANYH
jgi:hypothetical protein